MGRKIKSFSSFALVALCAGVLVAVLIGASPAPGAPAPPPGGCGTTTGDGGGEEGGGIVTGGVVTGAAVPAAECPPAPTTPPPGVTSTPTTGGTTTGTSTTGTTTAPNPTNPTSTVTTPVLGTVQGTTPTSKPKTTKLPATPVNVISTPATTSTPAPPPPVTSHVTTPPKINSPAVVTAKPHKPRIRHGRRHHHRSRVAKHHKASVPPPPATPPVHSKPKLPDPVQVTQSVATPAQTRFKATDALAAVLLAGFLVLLLAFPAELFNKTYDENEEEIHGLLARMGLRRHHLSRFAGALAFVIVGAGLSVWLALGEGSDGNPLAVGVGVLVAVPVVMFAFEFPAELYLRTRSNIPGSLRVLPTALLVGAACAVISRAIHLEPAYLYGVFAGYTAARAGALAEEEEGKSVMVGALALAVLAIICWFAWGALDGQAHGDQRGWFVILVSTAFFWVFVLAAESLVFGLIPLKYLDGSRLRQWRTSAWLVLQLLAAAFFIYVQMLHGSTKHVNTLNDVIRPFCLFAGFGLLSFAFWGYFQWKGRPTAGHGEEASEESAAAEAPAPTPTPTPPVAEPALLTAADAIPGRTPDPGSPPG